MDDEPIIDFTTDDQGTSDPDSRGERGAALARLRLALLATDARIAPESVHGETVEVLEASFAAAVAALPPRIPAGAPGRIGAHARTPRDKIREGLAHLA